MIVSEFSETCQLYKDFQVWEVENMEAFFQGNEVLMKIFEDTYEVTVKKYLEKETDIQDSNIDVITNLLQLVDDKSFFIFTYHDENHLELVKMQRMKVMNFGVDIEDVKKDKVYVIIMDKKIMASYT